MGISEGAPCQDGPVPRKTRPTMVGQVLSIGLPAKTPAAPIRSRSPLAESGLSPATAAAEAAGAATAVPRILRGRNSPDHEATAGAMSTRPRSTQTSSLWSRPGRCTPIWPSGKPQEGGAKFQVQRLAALEKTARDFGFKLVEDPTLAT